LLGHAIAQGTPLGSACGGMLVRHTFPLNGRYTVKVRLRRAFSNAGIIGLNVRERMDVFLDGVRLKTFPIGGECVDSQDSRCIAPPGVQESSEYEMTADNGLEVTFSADAGERTVGVSFAERSAAVSEAPAGGRGGGGGGMSVDRVIVEGPFDAKGPGPVESRERIFLCRPESTAEEEPCARKILSTLARRAYRRPVTDEEVGTLLDFYRKGASDGFEPGVRLALERLLVSPNFLLRIERDPSNVSSGTAYRVGDFELASRLSFFLWSSAPDDQLLDVAARKKLSDPAVLTEQVRRMLADQRASELVKNFAAQWLYLRDLRKVVPDPIVFSEFNDTLREAFERETELFLESQLREDRPLSELLTANYTFVNGRLAQFYGIPNVYGTHFRRVALTDPNRAGLLGQSSVLTVTSYATRTSPVQRGKYVLANILGTPPPPPPPDVPSLEENAPNAPTTVRERMEQHRRNPACGSCHSRMDPIGFALEKFDGIGRWRATEGGKPIDATGKLPDGATFDGPAELRNVLAAHQADFVRTVSEKLLTYALGRGIGWYDMPAIRGILRSAGPSDYRWSAVILGIVRSTPLQMRKAPEPVVDQTSAQR
jgi:hypothetical protein